MACLPTSRAEPPVFELHECSGTSRSEANHETGGARRHLLIAGLAPGDFDEAGALDTHERAANDDAVDVDGEEAAVPDLKSGEIAHPADEHWTRPSYVGTASRRRRSSRTASVGAESSARSLCCWAISRFPA